MMEVPGVPPSRPTFSIPLCWVEAAAGRLPYMPAPLMPCSVVSCEPPPWLLLLPQAESAVAPASATARAPTMRLFFVIFIVSPPPSRHSRHRSAVGSSCVALLSLLPPGQPDRQPPRHRVTVSGSQSRSVVPSSPQLVQPPPDRPEGPPGEHCWLPTRKA